MFFCMKLALAGGGTLGHVIPALSVLDEARMLDPDLDAFYIGSRKVEEGEIVRAHGVRFIPISTGKLRRYFSLENLADVFRTIRGFFQARRILKRERPDVLFSKGGYVSVPVVLAAASLHIRVITHESDATIGLANRINSRYAEAVCMGFDSPLCDGKKFIHTGNPVRSDLVKVKGENIPQEDDLILVLGGSQGAAEINSLVYENLDALCSKWRLIHQCGKTGDISIVHNNYSQQVFIGDELPSLMARATVVVSRAGAGAIGELCALGKASLLVPLAHASRGDQVENAKLLEERKAALVLHERGDFVEKIGHLMEDGEYRKTVERAAGKEGSTEGARLIANLVIKGNV